MSRSFKKHPWVTDHHVKSSKESKKFANKAVRNKEDLPNGKAYKKVYESWDICDYKYIWTWKEAKKQWEEEPPTSYIKRCHPTLKSYYRYWLRCTKGK